jgi:DUF4097 and DUF4098 domain-containing protein YvlB
MNTRNANHLPLCASLALLAMPLAADAATRQVSERRPAAADGIVEISNVAGSVTVNGWDKAEVEVTGTLGDKVERLEFTGTGNRTTVRVVLPARSGWGGDSEARLTIRVPAKSAVRASLVSADLRTDGVSGDQELQSVSGDISGTAGGNLEVESVSGDVKLSAPNARNTEIETVSGNATLTGASGDIELSTVSGDARLKLGTVSRARFSAVSGDVDFAGTLARGGRIEAEAVSGDVALRFTGALAAEIDVQSFSGDIRNCFGPKPVTARAGPGSSLQFQHGSGDGRVSIETKSGNISVCDR